MILKYVKIILVLQATSTQGGKYCNIISADEKKCHLRESLVIIDHSANQIAVDKKSNTLYFSFDAGQGEFNPALIGIDSKKLKLLKGVKDAFAIATDDKTGDVYFGGSNGIYKYSHLTSKLMRLDIKQLDVWWLVIRNHIYYIQFPDLKAYVYKCKMIKLLEQLYNSVMNQFVFDAEKNIYFINGTGLYRVGRDDTKVVLLRSTPKFLGMTTNIYGTVYVCSDSGIYYIRKDQKLAKYVSIQGVLALTFDKDNHLIYSDSRELVRLLPMEKRIKKNESRKSLTGEVRNVTVCEVFTMLVSPKPKAIVEEEHQCSNSLNTL
ncbi:ommochrome-binding protein-like [Leguminivora glycinivorella]|uniref:ommochrome-binding protein-like n=1 Tax=Leguminivora glycinivorella TaxID=1035111 RepID=UPI00200CDCB8|nr:ommochrome-binding protein-like [Leguminivora glycinivorella]